jgi:hypothetical protein
MKVVRKEIESSFTKEDFGKALGIKVVDWYMGDDFIKLYTKDNIFYLRCEDVRQVLKINYNIFGEDVSMKKDKSAIIVKREKEVFRGKVKKWKKSSLN